ncbi:hypothetical protein CYY_004170 [Polysphondylium violaceum]|uniref:F-box domain-containing protein n=1 Tax=Polysphondylium violaceum TaxID=133409 RepID=A0A8J4PV18_9MYCE|nr:hypothetical protein CYY_004170 [Polysphondylium violaceum]
MSLPTLIQKQILDYIYYQDKQDYITKGGKYSLRYALVDKQWFKISKQILNNNTILPINIIENSNNSNSHSQLRLITKESIQQIAIKFRDIKGYIEIVNRLYKSVNSITITHSDHNDGWINESLWFLNHLNKLDRIDSINVNFEMSLFCENPANTRLGEKEIKVPFKFKTNHFKVEYQYECENYELKTYAYIYEMIKDLNPKSIEFFSDPASEDGASHLKMFHSLSKLDNQYQSILIAYDYIPLYSLYRFLQSPTLKIFKFNLQFHFIRALYNDKQNNDDGDGGGNFNFNVMDNFLFKDFHNNSYEFEMQQCIENNVNEDNQVYCTFDEWGDCNPTIPNYSKQLWKECLHLLANNKTITELSIGDTICGKPCYGEKKAAYQQLFDDLLDSLSKNKSIKTLSFDFVELDLAHHPINKEFLSTLIQNNTTLESIYVGVEYRDGIIKSMFDDLSKSMPSNSKCVIKINTYEP